jgi:hypothetical protein
MSLSQELSEYETKQIDAIRAWKLEEPGVVSKSVGWITIPVVWLFHRIVPTAAIQGVLDAANWAGYTMADSGDITRKGGVDQISDLKDKSLELSDTLANRVHNWAIGVATAEGGATGSAGLAGIVLDIPAIITLALRTVHKIGLCYGYDCSGEPNKSFVQGILSASGANSMSEKIAALATLRSIEVSVAKQTWKALAEKAATLQFSKEAGIISIRNLAKQLGVNLTKRKVLQAIPGIGAAVGASVNGWYIKEVGWGARRAFQERWLTDNHKILEV